MSATTLAVYIPIGSANCELCQPVNESDFETISRLVDGTPRADEWRPIEMEIIREDEGKRLVESDAPWFGSDALMLRPSATTALLALLRRSGELLTLRTHDAQLCVFNPRRLCDALDVETSSLTRFKSGRIMSIDRFAFRADAVRGIDAFKISDLRVSPTFVSQQFVDSWRGAGLRGIDFELKWMTAT